MSHFVLNSEGNHVMRSEASLNNTKDQEQTIAFWLSGTFYVILVMPLRGKSSRPFTFQLISSKKRQLVSRA